MLICFIRSGCFCVLDCIRGQCVGSQSSPKYRSSWLCETKRNISKANYITYSSWIIRKSRWKRSLFPTARLIRTNHILSNFSDSRVRSIILPAHGGKAEALNRAIEAANGDIIVFMDARQRVATDSLKMLVESFADPTVGCVSGALMLGDREETSPRGVGSYWKMEKAIRYWECTGGSTVGATGALYAVRRSLVPRLPAGIILDDVFIPMEVVRRGSASDFSAASPRVG